MKITVRVKPNAKRERVEKVGECDFLVRVRAPARGGRANARLVELLSGYLSLPKTSISIIRGHASKIKIIETA